VPATSWILHTAGFPRDRNAVAMRRRSLDGRLSGGDGIGIGDLLVMCEVLHEGCPGGARQR
jgi:hypothetical protein